jgi:hypothetical protein
MTANRHMNNLEIVDNHGVSSPQGVQHDFKRAFFEREWVPSSGFFQELRDPDHGSTQFTAELCQHGALAPARLTS